MRRSESVSMLISEEIAFVWSAARLFAELGMLMDILVSFQDCNWSQHGVQPIFPQPLRLLFTLLDLILSILIPFPREIFDETSRGDLRWHISDRSLSAATERVGGGQ